MEDLLLWLKERHQELVDRTQITIKDEIPFSELNRRMAEYSGNFSWAIAETLIAEQSYRRKKFEFDEWYYSLFTEVKDDLPNGTSVKGIEAQMASDNPREWKQWKEVLSQLEIQKNARYEFISVWKSLKDIYVELSRNMREDFRSSGGLSTMEENTDRVDKVKRIRRLRNESRKDP